jgi:hypothetical protein
MEAARLLKGCLMFFLLLALLYQAVIKGGRYVK